MSRDRAGDPTDRDPADRDPAGVDPGGDEALDALIRNAFDQFDPVPESAKRFARESHRLVSFADEIAAISTDSLVDAGRSRSGSPTRTITFEAPRVSIRIECGSEIVGSIESASPVRLQVQRIDGGLEPVPVSDDGFFSFAAPTAAFRLLVTGEELSTRVTSDWVQA